LAAKNSRSSGSESESQPFGAGAVDSPAAVEGRAQKESDGGERKKRRPRRRREKDGQETATEPREQKAETAPEAGAAKPARDDAPASETKERAGGGEDGPPRESARQAKRRRWQERRRKRRGKRRGGGGEGEGGGQGGQTQTAGEPKRPRGQRQDVPAEKREVEGMLVLEKANHGHLRTRENSLLPTKQDVHVAPGLVQKLELREGSFIKGKVRRGQGRHKWELADVEEVDGKPPGEMRNLPAFKKLTSIDPDFHYAVGDSSGDVSLKVIDLLCPVGRGQRGLIVAPPRSGKTVLLQSFAKAIETTYPEVHLIVLLVDERPEEATEWQRSIDHGEVYVSTNDEMAKRHVELAESVWRRCKRLVEMGEDVVLLLDSITRLGRAYNNVKGDSGRTMSGGLDTRALERPKQFFGAARNTETAGSLTILGTTLIDTGSRMDHVIFEEFKGTGNMELVLSRKLADRRVFPAIDIEKTGTRKEEKLHSSRRMHRVNTLRRVLTRMHWAEAMDLLVTKLDEVEKIDDFLERFEIDPEA
jgi:transcription termination factor Rho